MLALMSNRCVFTACAEVGFGLKSCFKLDACGCSCRAGASLLLVQKQHSGLMQGGLSSLFCISSVTNGLLCCVKFDPLALVSLQPARPARKLLSLRRQTASHWPQTCTHAHASHQFHHISRLICPCMCLFRPARPSREWLSLRQQTACTPRTVSC